MITSANSPVAVRSDIVDAHNVAWTRISRPGAWFDGETRLAVAAETRRASTCALCARRKAALSPYVIDGRHDDLGKLPERLVEQIHRIVTDPGRLTRRWFESVIASGTSDAEHVETDGVVVTVISIDPFFPAIG